MKFKLYNWYFHSLQATHENRHVVIAQWNIIWSFTEKYNYLLSMYRSCHRLGNLAQLYKWGLSYYLFPYLPSLLHTGSLINSAAAEGEESPSSSTSLDQDSSFMGPFDPEQLPAEIQDAIYDPRMFASKEIYIDPDIIGMNFK